jgi:hypothetical protein
VRESPGRDWAPGLVFQFENGADPSRDPLHPVSSAPYGPPNSQHQLLGGFLRGFASGGSGVASGGSGVASDGGSVTSSGSGVASSGGDVGRSGGSGVNGGVAGSSGSVRRGSGGVRGGFSSFASGSSGVSSGFLRGFNGFFLLGAASKGQGGEGSGEGDLRVH